MGLGLSVWDCRNTAHRDLQTDATTQVVGKAANILLPTVATRRVGCSDACASSSVAGAASLALNACQLSHCRITGTNPTASLGEPRTGYRPGGLVASLQQLSAANLILYFILWAAFASLAPPY